VRCHLVKPRPFCGRDYLWVTDQRNREAADRQFWKNLARPEGLEPPTYRFEVVLGTYSQGLGRKRYPILLGFTTFLFFLVSALPVQSGHQLVTNDPPVDQLAYRFTIFRPLESNRETASYKGLRPACDHSIWGLDGSSGNISTGGMQSDGHSTHHKEH